MDNNNSEHPCIFQWNISNPFLPWEAMEATFYSAARTLIQWTVTIEPMGRSLNNWIFSFSLRAEEFDEFDEIETHRVQIEFSINERRVARERVQNYCFENSNHHTYYFQTHAAMRPTFQKPVLVVKVEIYLPAAPPPINPMAVSWYEEDQMQLSEDLKRLLYNEFYSNMRLLPNDDDDDDTFGVHSCIIDVRWNNLFRIHSSANDDNAQVEMNIPETLLWMILVYMYSGRLHHFWPYWSVESVIAQLFEVIDRYKLYHLYKVFVKSDSQQLRDTVRDLNFCGYDLALGVGNISPITLPVYYHNHDAFLLHIRVWRDVHQVRLAYSMEPIKNIGRIHVQVSLQFVKQISRPGHRRLRRILSVHEQDYDVRPYESVQSGEVIFSLNETIFDDFVLGNRFVRRRRIDHFLRCIIYLSDGTSLMRVANILDNTVQNERGRFSVLGDHMHALLITQRESDLRIICRSGHNDEQVYPAHKAIFSTRVPKYWRVLGNVRREGDIPDIVTCPFSIEAFRHILLYIYTGKIRLYPYSPLYIDEVYRFAQQSEFNALINLVNRMRGR